VAVKAITICQPYAHLIATGRKVCENRTWYTPHRGPLAIHAGKSRAWLDCDKGEDVDHGSGIKVSEMAFGAIVAVADLINCIHIDNKLIVEALATMTDEQRDHVNGPWCFILDNVRPLKSPIAYRGAQLLFEIPDEDLSPFL
jgi:hypothetical protein